MASRFKKVLRSAKPFRSEANRAPAGGLVHPTGRVNMNTAATEYFVQLAAKENIDPEQYGVVLGGDEDKNEVAIWVVKPLAEGATMVRRDAGKRTITLYLSELFKELPMLRPATKRWCQVSVEEDREEGTYVVISLNMALDPKRLKKRMHMATMAHTPSP